MKDLLYWLRAKAFVWQCVLLDLAEGEAPKPQRPVRPAPYELVVGATVRDAIYVADKLHLPRERATSVDYVTHGALRGFSSTSRVFVTRFAQERFAGHRRLEEELHALSLRRVPVIFLAEDPR